MSESIKSGHISESTIARIAGNLMSGIVKTPALIDPAVVARAVVIAREIAAEVVRTAEDQDQQE